MRVSSPPTGDAAETGTTATLATVIPPPSTENFLFVSALASDIDQRFKRSVPAPAVDMEITVESQDAAGAKLRREVNQARVGQIHGNLGILLHQGAQLRRRLVDAKRNVKDAPPYVIQDRVGGAAQLAEQIAGFRNDRLAGDQRETSTGRRPGANLVVGLAAIEQGHDATSIEKYRFQRVPNPARCALLEPKSGLPEAKAPSPLMRRLPRPPCTTSNACNPRRRISESERPVARRRRASKRSPPSSSRA